MGRRMAAAVLLVAGVLSADEVVRLEWEPGFVGTNKVRPCPLGEAAPAGLTLPPPAEGVRFGLLELGHGSRVHFLVDTAPEPQVLRVDTDLDGDLAEESPRALAPRTAGGFSAVDTVLVPLEGEVSPLPVEIYFWKASREAQEIGVSLRIHRRGTVHLAGRIRDVALVDGNGDLRFDDAERDRFYLDLDGDGDLDGREQSHERLKIGEAFGLRGQGYVATLPDPLGGVLEIAGTRPVPAERLRHFEIRKPPPVREPGEPGPEDLATLRGRYEGAETTKARADVLGAIGRLSTKEAFAFLHDVATSSPDPATRHWALWELGQKPYVAYADQVARIARSKRTDPKERKYAVFALHNMDAPKRAPVLAEVLKSADDADLKVAAAEHLAYLGDDAGRRTLLKELKAEKDKAVRLRMYDAAAHADPGGPGKALLKAALEDEDDRVRGAALEDVRCFDAATARAVALETMARNDTVLNELLRPSIEILGGEADQKAVEALVVWMNTQGHVWSWLHRALVGVRDPGGIKAIVGGLQHDRERARSRCADLLGDIPEPAVADALAAALRREKDEGVLRRIARSLANLADPRTADELLAAARRRDFAARPEVLEALARIGPAEPRVTAFFRDLLDAPRWEDRVLALVVLAPSGDRSFLPAFLENLGHRVWQVRVAAAEAFRSLRVKEAVEPLVARLASEEEVRVRAAVAETLFRLTGKDLGDVHEAWAGWWKENGASFAVPGTVPERRAAPGETVASFFGIPVRSGRVCFVLDKSESMAAADPRSKQRRTRLEVAVEELLGAVGRLEDKARVNVVFFDTDVWSWKKSLVPLSAANRSALEKELRKQEPGTRTNLFGALAEAFEDESVDTIFLLSDGVPNEGPLTGTTAILNEVRRMNLTRRVAIHTISVGLDSALLRRLAADHDGTSTRR